MADAPPVKEATDPSPPAHAHDAATILEAPAASAPAPLTSSEPPIPVHDNGPIIRSPNDTREYRHITLPNGLQALLIHDPEADKAAAALDVNIGSLCDPMELQGLAHFLEHMLFLGTEKYPREEEYASFMSAHGGGTNAFTSDSHTNYYFYVSHEHLEAGLDRFAQFFLHPLFDPSCTEREINAVDSEHSKNLKIEAWRISQLQRTTSDPAHPFNRFTTGNKKTLSEDPRARGIDLRAALLAFHDRHYSARIMCLAILGRESLDELQRMVVGRFSAIRATDAAPLRPVGHPHGPAQLGRALYVNPVGETRTVQLSFPMKDDTRAYNSQASHYVSHLIGHEGEGSLLSYLKKKGWVTALTSGVYAGVVDCFAFFKITMTVSDSGIASVPAIIRACFQYMAMLRATGVQEWIFTECSQLLEMAFRFKEQAPPAHYCSQLAGNMHVYPAANILNHGYTMTEYRPDLIAEVLEQLRPSRMRLLVMSQGCAGEGAQIEQWYGTEYREEALSEEMIKEWASVGEEPGLTLPPVNEFIPTNFTVHVPAEHSPLPSLLRQDAHGKVWFKQDGTFKLPKANLKIALCSPAAYSDPLHANLSRLYVDVLKDSLVEFSYAAELSGLTYGFNNTSYGLEISLTGYTDKLQKMLTVLVDRMINITVSAERFAIVKEQYFRFLTNFKTNEPHRRVTYSASLVLGERIFSHDERLQELDHITAESVQAFAHVLLGRVHTELFAHGSMLPEQALEIADLLHATLAKYGGGRSLAPLEKALCMRELCLPDGCYFSYCTLSGVHSISAVEMIFQVGPESMQDNAVLELLAQIISAPCYAQLRTTEQLGYIVFSRVRRSSGVQGLSIIVQSDRDPVTLEARIIAFIDSVEGLLSGLSDEELGKHVEAVCSRKLEKPKTLIEESLRHWGEILSGYFLFGREDLEVPIIRSVTRDTLLAFFRMHLHRDSPKRRMLSLRTKPTSAPPPPEPDQSKAIVELAEFKHAHLLYPLPLPFMVQARM